MKHLYICRHFDISKPREKHLLVSNIPKIQAPHGALTSLQLRGLCRRILGDGTMLSLLAVRSQARLYHFQHIIMRTKGSCKSAARARHEVNEQYDLCCKPNACLNSRPSIQFINSLDDSMLGMTSSIPVYCDRAFISKAW